MMGLSLNGHKADGLAQSGRKYPVNTGTPKPPPESGSGSNQDGNASANTQSVAVAVDHDPSVDAVPKVVASGRGFGADQILNIAFASGVKVRQDADLAQILSVVDLDSEIPTEAFAAVAELLVYVYRANGTYPLLPTAPHLGGAMP